MAFKSKAQRLKMLSKVADGTLEPEKFEEWDKDTPKDIPDRVHKKKPMIAKPIKPIR